jgi:rSAM/selenodomain-associated transferase 1
MSEQLKKALLIFAKQPVPGKVKTRLSPPLFPEEAAELYRCMLGDVLATAAALTDVKQYLFYDGGEEALEYFRERAPAMTCVPQRGKELGERMENALRDVFSHGNGAAVIIGSDSPDLPAAFIEDAFGRLGQGEDVVVVGPSEDGGYYLIGMASLNRHLFRDIPWSSAHVMEETLKRAYGAHIAVSLLPMWRDVDTAADLERPELRDGRNGAPLTREFLLNRLKEKTEHSGFSLNTLSYKEKTREMSSMLIPVIYFDGYPGKVNSEELDNMIRRRLIVAFRRSNDWVRVGSGYIRGTGGGSYKGPDRRRN